MASRNGISGPLNLKKFACLAVHKFLATAMCIKLEVMRHQASFKYLSSIRKISVNYRSSVRQLSAVRSRVGQVSNITKCRPTCRRSIGLCYRPSVGRQSYAGACSEHDPCWLYFFLTGVVSSKMIVMRWLARKVHVFWRRVVVQPETQPREIAAASHRILKKPHAGNIQWMNGEKIPNPF